MTSELTSPEQVIEVLRARGGRVTGARRLLLAALFEKPEHWTAEDLVATVRSRSPQVSESTIYRNLVELERLGVVVHTHLGHGPATYQLAGEAHGHLVCERCGAAVDAPADLFQGLARTALSQVGFAIDPHHFSIGGLCVACRAENPRATGN